MNLTQIGLLFNIAGTTLLIFYGLPANLKDERGPAIIAEYDKKDLAEIIQHNNRIKVRAKVGILLTFIGFLFQLAQEFL